MITIDRPARFNALDVTTAQDSRRAGLQYARDDEVRVAVICGLPRMFCSGADLKFIRDGGNVGDLAYLSARPTPHDDAGDVNDAFPRYGDAFKQIDHHPRSDRAQSIP